MKRTVAIGLTLAFTATAHAADLKVPVTVQLPQLQSLVSPCSDPAADRFLELDLMQRPPAGATRVPRIGGWVTPDGIFNWPFVMRVRNLGDQPFIGQAGLQSVVVTEDDRLSGAKGKVVSNTPFAQIAAHSGVAARFLFSAPAADVEKGKFHRIYTLKLDYKKIDVALTGGRTGDCNLTNNTFTVEFNGKTKTWITVK